MEPLSMEPEDNSNTGSIRLAPLVRIGGDEEEAFLSTLGPCEYEAVMRYRNTFQNKEEMESFVKGLRG